MNHQIRLTAQGEGQIVIRKLCSTLVLYFSRPVSSWTYCIRTLACSFHAGTAISEEALERYGPIEGIISVLSPQQITSLLSFSMIFAEEVDKLDANDQ